MPHSFVRLRMHSEYSIVDGICRLGDAVAAAAADGQQALGLTDLGNTFGFIKFYGAARAKGVKPLLGADLCVTNPMDRNAPHRVLLLVQNDHDRSQRVGARSARVSSTEGCGSGL